MNPVKVFLIAVFVLGLTDCVLALVSGSLLLYNIGAVIALLTALVAMWPRILNYLNEDKD